MINNLSIVQAVTLWSVSIYCPGCYTVVSSLSIVQAVTLWSVLYPLSRLLHCGQFSIHCPGCYTVVSSLSIVQPVTLWYGTSTYSPVCHYGTSVWTYTNGLELLDECPDYVSRHEQCTYRQPWSFCKPNAYINITNASLYGTLKTKRRSVLYPLSRLLHCGQFSIHCPTCCTVVSYLSIVHAVVSPLPIVQPVTLWSVLYSLSSLLHYDRFCIHCPAWYTVISRLSVVYHCDQSSIHCLACYTVVSSLSIVQPVTLWSILYSLSRHFGTLVTSGPRLCAWRTLTATV